MYCILVAGMPASGKSTIAVRISESLGIPMLSKDSIKEVLFDDLGFHSRAEKVQLGTAAMHILYYAAAQLMKVGKPFILENNFEDASISGIMALLETHHYTAVTVHLTGDPEVIYRRFAARDLSDTRHRGHVVNDCYPEPPGAPLETPTRKSYEQFLDDIAARGYIRSFRKASGSPAKAAPSALEAPCAAGHAGSVPKNREHPCPPVHPAIAVHRTGSC